MQYKRYLEVFNASLFPFNYLFRVLALMPQSCSKVEKSYTILVAALLFFLNFYTSYYTYIYFIFTSMGTIKVFKSVCMNIISLLSILSVNWYNSNTYQDFICKLVTVNRMTGMCLDKKISTKWYRIILCFIIHGIFVGLFTYDIFISDEKDTYKYLYLLHCINHYWIFIFCLEMCTYIHQINISIKILNTEIQAIGDSICGGTHRRKWFRVTSVSNNFTDYFKENNLNYLKLCEIVDSFNATFGWQLLFTIFFIIASCLLGVGFIVFDASSNSLGSVHWTGKQYVALFIIWTICFLVRYWINYVLNSELGQVHEKFR